MKIYKAKSQISLTVNVNGGNVHVTFSPLTGGGSMFTTNDEQLEAALERHAKFGKLFKVIETKPVEVKKAAPKAVKKDESKVEVSSAEDAKEYLIDKFGISRTKLRTIKAIKETAEKKGIVFEGI